MTTYNAPTLGVVELPALSELLQSLGYRVITGATFPEAASAIKTALDTATDDTPFPILIADVHRPGIKAWTQKHSRIAPVMILRTGVEDYIVADGARSHALPSTVVEILEASALPVSADPRADLAVNADGTLGSPAPVAFTPAATSPAPAAVAAPDVQAPAAPAPPVSIDEEFGTFNVPNPVAPAPAAPVPTPTPAHAVVPPVATPAASVTPRAPWDLDTNADEEAEPADTLFAPVPVPLPERAPQTLFLDEGSEDTEDVVDVVERTNTFDPAQFDLPEVAPAPEPVPAPAPDLVDVPAPVQVTAPVVVQVTAPVVEAPAAPWGNIPVAQPVAPVYTPAADIEQPAALLPAPAAPAALLPAQEALEVEVPEAAAPRLNFFAQPGASLDDSSDLFGASAPVVHASGPVSAPMRAGVAPVIFNWAYKGGVNKTSLSLQQAHRAAEMGLRVWLIDMNRGQGGIRTVLRIPENAPVRSAFDAARLGDPARAFLRPDDVAPYRPANLDPIKFGLVLAPPRAEADPAQTPYPVYQQILDHARATADLVIVDTQTVEAVDASGLISNVMVPAMIHGGWGVAITAFAKESVENLKAAFAAYGAQGLTRDRQLLVVTRVEDFLPVDAQGVETTFQKFAHFAGTTANSVRVKEEFDRGAVVSDDPSVRPLIDSILFRVTGDDRFNSEPPAPPRTRRFSFLRGGKK